MGLFSDAVAGVVDVLRKGKDLAVSVGNDFVDYVVDNTINAFNLAKDYINAGRQEIENQLEQRDDVLQEATNIYNKAKDLLTEGKDVLTSPERRQEILDQIPLLNRSRQAVTKANNDLQNMELDVNTALKETAANIYKVAKFLIFPAGYSLLSDQGNEITLLTRFKQVIEQTKDFLGLSKIQDPDERDEATKDATIRIIRAGAETQTGEAGYEVGLDAAKNVFSIAAGIPDFDVKKSIDKLLTIPKNATLVMLLSIFRKIYSVFGPRFAINLISSRLSKETPQTQQVVDFLGEISPDWLDKVGRGFLDLSGINSLSKVFGKWDLLEGSAAEPGNIDYIVAAIFIGTLGAGPILAVGAKLGLTGSAALVKVIPRVLTSTKGAFVIRNLFKGAVKKEADELFKIVAKAKPGQLETVTAATKTAIQKIGKVSPAAIGPYLRRVGALKILVAINTAAMLYMAAWQTDFICWAIDFCPSAWRDKIEKVFSQITGNLITISNFEKAQQFDKAVKLCEATTPLMDEAERLTLALPKKYLGIINLDFGDLNVLLVNARAKFDIQCSEYKSQIGLPDPLPSVPRSFTGKVINVLDGDTIDIERPEVATPEEGA